MSGMNYPLEEILLASIADRMAFIAWTKTKDAENNVGRPESILAKMLNKNSKAEDIVVFNSGEDFREARKRIIDGRE